MKKFLIATLLVPTVSLSAYCPCPYCPEQHGYGEYNEGGSHSGYREDSRYRQENGPQHHDRQQRGDRRYQNSQEQSYYQSSGDQYATSLDRDLLVSIREQLNDQNNTRNGNQITVVIDHGSVTLFGQVDNEEEKNRILENIRDVEGVKDVSFEDRQKKSYNGRFDQRGQEPSQNQTQDRFQREQSYRYRSTSNQISDKYSQPNNYERTQSENSGRYSNQQQQQNKYNSQDQNSTYGTQQTQGSIQNSDETLKQKVKDKLTNTWFSKAYENVIIQVSNGTVTLRGNVESEKDKEDVEKRIRNIPEVKDIRVLITVDSEGSQKTFDQKSNRAYPRN